MSQKVLDMCKSLPVVEVTLNRGDTGLGFNIRGGIDIPHFKEDTGIFVTKLKAAGAAFKDKRIKEGDKILEVNGRDIRSITHNEAVQVFITAGETVSMKVQHGAESYIIKQLEANSNGMGTGLKLFLLLGVMAAGAAVGFMVMKNKD